MADDPTADTTAPTTSGTTIDGEGVSPSAETAASALIPKYRLFLFQTIDQAQSSHGLAHQQDYAQYHKYCTSKLYRLRHHNNVKSTLIHNTKYVSAGTNSNTVGSGKNNKKKKKGQKHAYCKRDIVMVAEECWWDVVFQAERAWANACEIQRDPKPKLHHRHQRVVKRLRKALRWANLLLQHAQKTNNGIAFRNESSQASGNDEEFHQQLPRYEVDPETLMECQAYADWMLGNLELERKKYLEAFRAYHRSMSVLLELAKRKNDSNEDTFSTSPEALARRDVWSNWSETILRPLVRFCGYEAQDSLDEESTEAWRMLVSSGGGGGGGPNDTVEKDGISQDTAAVDGSIVLSFRNKRVALDSYQELAVLYLKMEKQLQSDDVLDEDTFSKLSTHLDDAIHMVQTEYKHYESLPSGPAVQAKRNELLTIRQYFEYQKLDVWRKQQEGRLTSTKDEGDLLHVYDTLLKNAVAMADLQETQDHQDDPLWLEAQAHVLRFRSFRCYYLGRYYEDDQKNPQATALYEQALKLTQRAEEEVAACDGLARYLSDLDELSWQIRAVICRMDAKAFIVESGSYSVGSTHRPLWMRTNDWDDGHGKIADHPLLPIAIPRKPIFFDIAWQLVPRPDVTDELADYIASQETKPGFFAWLRGKS